MSYKHTHLWANYIKLFLRVSQTRQFLSTQTGWMTGESANVVVLELEIFLANAWWTMSMSTASPCTVINEFTIPIPLRFSSKPCRACPRSFLSHSWINSVLNSSVFILMDILAECWYREYVWLEFCKVDARSPKLKIGCTYFCYHADATISREFLKWEWEVFTRGLDSIGGCTDLFTGI